METKVQEQARVVSSLMAKIVQSAANVATSALDDMTTEYEKNRLVRIRKNKERLASLEIADAVAELKPKKRATAATTRRSKPASSAKKRRPLERQAKTAGRARTAAAANGSIAAAPAEAGAGMKAEATAVAVPRRKMKIFDAKVSDDAKFTTADVAAFPWYVHPKHTHMGPC